MIRTQVRLRRDQLEALRERAAREESSVAELIRRAVDAWLLDARGPSKQELNRALAAGGRFSSGRGDLAAEHDRHLSDVYGS